MKNSMKIICNAILLAFILQINPINAQNDEHFDTKSAAFGWSDGRDPESPRPSPNRVSALQLGFSRLMISYGSPALRGRKFGSTLVNWKSLWRTGANEGTTFTTTEDILVEGKKLKAGTYTILTIPGKNQWTVFFNSNPKIWMSYGYDTEKNVLEIKVPHQKVEKRQERMTFSFEDINTEDFSAKVVLSWADFKIAFVIKEL